MNENTKNSQKHTYDGFTICINFDHTERVQKNNNLYFTCMHVDSTERVQAANLFDSFNVWFLFLIPCGE